MKKKKKNKQKERKAKAHHQAVIKHTKTKTTWANAAKGAGNKQAALLPKCFLDAANR